MAALPPTDALVRDADSLARDVGSGIRSQNLTRRRGGGW